MRRPTPFRRSVPLALLLLTVLLSGSALANDGQTEVPGYTIFHNILRTDILTPEVAARYGIRRSPKRAMLNVSVRQMDGSLVGLPATARVVAHSRTLIGQRTELEMRELREADAIYYINEFPIHNGLDLTFELEVTPAASGQTHSISFRQDFYTD